MLPLPTPVKEYWAVMFAPLALAEGVEGKVYVNSSSVPVTTVTAKVPS